MCCRLARARGEWRKAGELVGSIVGWYENGLGRQELPEADSHSRRPRADQPSSLAQEMARIPARILPQIVLVVGLRAVPGAGRLDGGGDRTPPLSRSVDARDHAAGDLLLLR